MRRINFALLSAVGVVRSRGVTAVLAVLTLINCGEPTGPGIAAVVPVHSVVVNPDTATLKPGEIRQLTATTKDSAGGVLTGRTITWRSSSTAVASVSGNTVTGVDGGVAIITATSEGRSGVATITVRVPVASVTVTPGSARIQPGDSLDFAATALDSVGGPLAGRTMTWSSSDTAIATVTAAGLVKARQVEGSVTITAETETRQGTATVVVGAPVHSLVLDTTSFSLQPGGTRTLVATLRDSLERSLTGRLVTWRSTDTSVARVDAGGTVTAKVDGSARIIATSEERSDTATVTVETPIGSIDIPLDTISLFLGARHSLAVTLLDSAGAELTGRPVAWASTDSFVATVDSTGTITTVALGRTTIAATSGGVTDSAAVVVTSVPVSSIAFAAPADSIMLGDIVQLRADVKDSAGALLPDRPLAWTSSDTTVVSVDGGGRVLGRTLGTATVSAGAEGKSASASLTVLTVPVAVVSVAPRVLSLERGDSTDILALPLDADSSALEGRAVTWVSSDSTIARVTATGNVKARKVGTAVIRATSESRVDSAIVTVTALTPIANIIVQPDTIRVTVGDTTHIGVTIVDSTGRILPNRIYRGGSAVSDSGALIGHAVLHNMHNVTNTTHRDLVRGEKVGTGTVRIYAYNALIDRLVEDPLTGLAPIQVDIPIVVDPAPAIASVKFVSPEDTRTETEPFGVGWEVRDVNGRLQALHTVSLTSSDSTIAKVRYVNGYSTDHITGGRQGTAWLYVKAGEFVDSMRITILPARVGNMFIIPSPAEVQVGATMQLSARIETLWGTNIDRVATWTMRRPDGVWMDTTVASVTSTGLLTGKKLGTTEVWAWTPRGGSATDSAGRTVTVRVVPAGVHTIAVTPNPATVSLGLTRQLTATPQDQSGNPLASRGVTFASSNTGVVSVTSTGLLTGKALGTANVTVTSDSKSVTVPVTVRPAGPAASVTIEPAQVSVPTQRSITLAATVRDSTGSALTGKAIAWSVADASVATVTSAGVLTGVRIGGTTVTATSEGRSGTATVNVTSAPPPLAQIDIVPQPLAVAKGATVQLTALTYLHTGLTNDRPVSWRTLDPAIATVSSAGLLAGAALGSTSVIATADGAADTATVTVTSGTGPVASVLVSPDPAIVTMNGGVITLTAQPRDAAGALLAGRGVTWASNDTSVVHVSASGRVTGRAEGTAIVTATSEGAVGSAVVHSRPPVTVREVQVHKELNRQWIAYEENVQFRARAIGSDGFEMRDATFTWRSDNPAIAIVSQDGVVTGKGTGEVRIYAATGGSEGFAEISSFPAHIVDRVTIGQVRWPTTLMVDSTALVGASIRNHLGDLLDRQQPLTWRSSDTTIVTIAPVDSPSTFRGHQALITAKKVGTAIIGAMSGGASDTMLVVVHAAPAPAGILLTPGGGTMQIGEKVQFTARVVDAAGTVLPNKPITWSSGNTGAVTLTSGGLATAKSGGTSKITARHGSLEAFEWVQVASSGGQVSSSALTITPNPTTIKVGGTAQLRATIRDHLGTIVTGEPVLWESSNDGIATVWNGLVVGRSVGTVTITARGARLRGTATVHVGTSSGGGGGGGTGGGGGGSGGACHTVVAIGNPGAGNTSGWVTTSRFPGLDVRVKMSSKIDNSSSPYEYTLYARSRYTQVTVFGFNLKVNTRPTGSFGTTTVAAGNSEYVDYFYGPSGTIYVYVANLTVGGRSQC